MFYYLILGNSLHTSPVSSIINLLSIFSGFSRHPNPCVPASDETGSEFGEQAGRQASRQVGSSSVQDPSELKSGPASTCGCKNTPKLGQK